MGLIILTLKRCFSEEIAVAYYVLQELLDEYPKCFIVAADNVGSSQMQKIRISLRGTAGRAHKHMIQRVNIRYLYCADYFIFPAFNL